MVASEAIEVSLDDPHGVAEAMQRASRGSTVHLVRDGQPIADIVPAPAERADNARPGRDPRHGQVIGEHSARFGVPIMQHYRQISATAGRDWLGEDYILAHYPVSDSP